MKKKNNKNNYIKLMENVENLSSIEFVHNFYLFLRY